jgi:hypothetical protein
MDRRVFMAATAAGVLTPTVTPAKNVPQQAWTG